MTMRAHAAAIPTAPDRSWPFHATMMAALFLMAAPPAVADNPWGWTGSDHVSAYTPQQGELHLRAEGLKVNTDIDFLDFRDDLVADSRRLEGDSGDLEGFAGSLEFGITSWLGIFYREQHQDLSLRLNEPDRVDMQEVDQSLDTRWRHYGIKWNLYEAGYADRSNPWHALSLELTRSESDSDPFDARVRRIDLNANTRAVFDPPQRFSINAMEDEGWRGRLIYTLPIGGNSSASLWAGYGRFEASAGTGTGVDTGFIREAVEQRIDIDENQVLAGASLDWSITPRLPIQLGYEYINTTSRDTRVDSADSGLDLPSFLRIDNLSLVDSNHTVYAAASYWLTPRLRLGLSARLFANQFQGIMPHFNNPLSDSFADITYGYAGLHLGYQFTLPGM